MIDFLAGQPVKHHPRPAPQCVESGCRRSGHHRGRLCAKHADEAEQRQFAVIDSYLPGGSRHTLT